MDFYDVIKKRTSVKSFKDTSIDTEKLNRIIKASMMAPSWKNNTSYKFILVDDKVKKENLSQCIYNETDEAIKSVKEAPMVVVVVGNPNNSGIIDGREYYLVDAAVSMEHFVLAATREGYGTCWIGSIDEEGVKDILAISENYRVVAMTPIGEVNEPVQHNPKKDIKEHVFINTWETPYTNTINNPPIK